MFKIEKGIPIPPRKHGPHKGHRHDGFPFDQMPVGYSFHYKLHWTVSLHDAINMAGNLRANISYFQRHSNKRFTVRKTLHGFRVWRVK